jgi:hypothetical protein
LRASALARRALARITTKTLARNDYLSLPIVFKKYKRLSFFTPVKN